MTSEEETVTGFLNKNPEFLQDYISKLLPVSSQIDLAHQILAITDKSESVSGSQFLRHAAVSQASDSDKLTAALWDLCYQLSQLIEADGFHLLLSDASGESLNLIVPENKSESR